MRLTTCTTVLYAALNVLGAGLVQGDETSQPTVDGFQQLLPRGAIAALVDPSFVAATAASVPDDAWVLGFARDGEAFAYDLNLLNSHEVVNHTLGTLPIAAVW